LALPDLHTAQNAEQRRLDASNAASGNDSSGRGADWKFWGPYLSERQWGTVREDYSQDGNAWDYFSHDQARSRAYRWGEDGLAGISDEKQRLCFAIALWNGADPIVKERLFGLTNSEGNHGEDVKEYYFYLDSTPTHSYMKYLYKYPHRAYPYDDIVSTNRARGKSDPEYELLDTGVFRENRYFDVFVEYAKASPRDLLIRITVENRGAEPASLHLLPTLWFRNTWSWASGASSKPVMDDGGTDSQTRQAAEKWGQAAFFAGEAVTESGVPNDEKGASPHFSASVRARHSEIGEYGLWCDGQPELLFTENETNQERVFNKPSASPFVKDAFDSYLVHGNTQAVNPSRTGTKAAAHYFLTIPAGGREVVRLRLRSVQEPEPAQNFDQIFVTRIGEADEFYDSITPISLTPDQRLVMRQALAGLLWSKQYYGFDLDVWLSEHGYVSALRFRGRDLRNTQWYHMVNDDVISMPDKWEYPWYAAWDLAFHTIALSLVDVDFAKQQLSLMLCEKYLHPNGQIPAYEWNFGDVNPPVHAWATLFVYQMEKHRRGKGDVEFLEAAFQKLLLNFTWWVNRKDRTGRNLFEGGFLGMDNIGVFDRSAPLPTGGFIEQADGTAWMAMYCQNMLGMILELAAYDPGMESIATKFMEHFLWIAGGMNRAGAQEDEMWDEEDGFFYDVLCLPDGNTQRLKIRSLVGLLPLCAVAVLSPEFVDRFPNAMARMKDFFARHRAFAANLHDPGLVGEGGRHLLSVLDERSLRRVLARMLDEERFLSPYGIRSLSKSHEKNPFVFTVQGHEFRVAYEPAESRSGMFGGNSNWRGPIWFPMNMLIVRALILLYEYYGDRFKVECPTGSGRQMNLFEVARELGGRLENIFVRDGSGKRAVFGGSEVFQNDPHWRDCILFYEYFNGDNGAGVGASHQTGWTGTVARLIEFFGAIRAEDLMNPSPRASKSNVESSTPVEVEV
jgi:hypothetical protein